MTTLMPKIKLTSINYHAWKTHMTFIFRFRHILDIATNASSKPTAFAPQADQLTWQTKNEEALGLIKISLSPKLYVLISTCAEAHQAWDILKNTYDSADETRKIQLQDQRKER